jgi:signal transduction histidine kinase
MTSPGILNNQDKKDQEPLKRRAREIKEEYEPGAKTLLQFEEEERETIAREIHDDLSQPLTAIKINLSGLLRKIPQENIPLLKRVEQILDLVDSMTGSVKRISVELRPGVLDDLGLIAAIEWQAGYFQETTGIRCELDKIPKNIAFDRQLSTAIFRILQKVLVHIKEEASATSVIISLKKKTDRLFLKVTDNGNGTTAEPILNHLPLGLIEVFEHAHLFGINIKKNGKTHGGNTITMSIPLNQKGGQL